VPVSCHPRPGLKSSLLLPLSGTSILVVTLLISIVIFLVFVPVVQLVASAISLLQK
jgi:hypothetical protein